jgi:1-acyl-sn-glycerol-3-phosphate acyltransferase
LEGATERFDPYADHRLFHGPAYQLASWVVRGTNGADALLDASSGGVPPMTVHPALLDAATHLIPHDQLHLWCPELGDEVVSYPHRVEQLRFDGPIPGGEVTAQVRFDGLDGPRHPAFQIRLLDGDRVWASMRLVEIAMPKGPIGAADPASRRGFLEGEAGTGVSLSRVGRTTSLTPGDVLRSDWLPGTMSAVYGTRDPVRIAVQEHVAGLTGVHPSAVTWDGSVARVPTQPLTKFVVEVRQERGVSVTGGPQLDLTRVRSFWARHFDVGRWPVEDLYYGLVRRFVSGVTLTDPEAMSAIRGRGALFLGNHQVGIESLLLSVVVSALIEVPTATLAKAEHMETWLGRLIGHCFAYPEVTDPEVIVFFDRSKKEDLGKILQELGRSLAAGEKALMVHADGTRATSCRTPVEKLSSVFVDLAVSAGLPIVPVWLSGGLPVEPVSERLELPVGMAKQRFTLGRPILPQELAGLPYADRRGRVLEAINGLAPVDEQPGAPDGGFADAVASRMVETGVDQVHAAMFETLAGLGNPSDEVAMLLGDGPLRLPDNEHGQWLAELARRLYGPRGRQVLVG